MSVTAKRHITSELAKEFGLKACPKCGRHFFTKIMFDLHLKQGHVDQSTMMTPTPTPSRQGSRSTPRSATQSQISTVVKPPVSKTPKQTYTSPPSITPSGQVESSPEQTPSPSVDQKVHNYVTRSKTVNDSVTKTKQKSFKCKECPNTYTTYTSLKRHTTINHSEGKGHKCKFCPEQFFFNYELQKHIKLLHKDEKENEKEEIEVTPCQTILIGSTYEISQSSFLESKDKKELEKHCQKDKEASPIQGTVTESDNNKEQDVKIEQNDQQDMDIVPFKSNLCDNKQDIKYLKADLKKKTDDGVSQESMEESPIQNNTTDCNTQDIQSLHTESNVQNNFENMEQEAMDVSPIQIIQVENKPDLKKDQADMEIGSIESIASNKHDIHQVHKKEKDHGIILEKKVQEVMEVNPIESPKTETEPDVQTLCAENGTQLDPMDALPIDITPKFALPETDDNKI